MFLCINSSSSPSLDPPKLSILPQGTCHNWAALEEGRQRLHGGHQAPLSKEKSSFMEALAKQTQLTSEQHGLEPHGSTYM